MKIYKSFEEGILKLGLAGELDHHEAKETMKRINEILDEYFPQTCVLDLSRLTFMDSSGIAVIIRTNKKLASWGGKALVEAPKGQPLRVLNASGLDRIIKIYTEKK